jgi:hypothetical protein
VNCHVRLKHGRIISAREIINYTLEKTARRLRWD